ncbi:hypothetical protein [Rhizobium sp. CF142]|uniref:hypothetical protein n=1 Tax=Rhizobium sp. CF142 TaxID=1144314 RepID=UPI00026EFA31|nr:hypothetical protein [Rhizobium sp. CF142]EJJ26442.1 hypothetical protein PMI11_05360 [Rhizobium sp. CF142]
MTNLPIDTSWQEADFDRVPLGTYWTPLIPVSIHELEPRLRAALTLAITAPERMDQFETHLAHAFDMEPANHPPAVGHRRES